MSLILDALKKSEAERTRGIPPRLHTPYVTVQRDRPAWIVPTVAVAILAAGGAGWLTLTTPRGAKSGLAETAPSVETPTQTQATQPSTEESNDARLQPIAAAVQDEPIVAMGGAGTAGTGGSAGLAVPQRADLYSPPTNATTQVAQIAQPASGQPLATAETAVTSPAATAEETSPPAPAMMPVAESTAPAESIVTAMDAGTNLPDVGTASTPIESTPIESMPPAQQMLMVYQLPYSIRKDLPKLDLSMHVYSPVREERFVVLNGKRYELDGVSPGPEISLLDISDEGAIMEFRGKKFLLPRQTF